MFGNNYGLLHTLEYKSCWLENCRWSMLVFRRKIAYSVFYYLWVVM